ncbi:hypothetical protein B1174_12740 [Enterococcus faecium]|nr:hypothetical protein B1174_12740 [Enterococcus faecium]
MYKREKNNKIVYMNILPFLLSMKKYFNFIFSFQIILLVTSLNYKNSSTASSADLLFFSLFIS